MFASNNSCLLSYGNIKTQESQQNYANYIPYSDLAKYINSLDIGVPLPLCPDIVSLNGTQDIPPVGTFRDVCVHI